MFGIRIGERTLGQIFFAVSILVLISIFAGCASTPKVNPKLVQQYQPPVSVGDDETLIYVIRQSAFVGAAQHIWVACNDEYKANLASGTYCYFKTPAGLNTINLRQMQIPLAFYRVDFRPKETVFLYFEYTKGLFYELETDVGKSLVMSLKKGKTFDESEENTDYEIGLMNPGFVGLYLMKETEEAPEADDNHALVSFIRGEGLVEDTSFGIWNQNGFLGNLKGKTFFTVKLPPGEHTFIANSRYYSALNAQLDASKHYYVKFEVSRGWSQANVGLLPIGATNQSEIQGLLNECKKVALDESAIDENIQERLDASMPLIQETIRRVESGELEFKSLKSDLGRIQS